MPFMMMSPKVRIQRCGSFSEGSQPRNVHTPASRQQQLRVRLHFVPINTSVT